MKFLQEDTRVKLYFYNEKKEFTHSDEILIKAHTGYPAKSTDEQLPDYDNESERCYFTDGKWVKTRNYIGRPYWNDCAEMFFIETFPEELPNNIYFNEPPEPEDGFVIRMIDGKWKQIENHIGKLAYLKEDCIQYIYVDYIGPLKKEWTFKKPKTQFDEWVNDNWVTNASKKYIADFNDVDEKRRSLYLTTCDPLFAEANVKRIQGNECEAKEIEAQALAARENIKMNNPFPKSV